MNVSSKKWLFWLSLIILLFSAGGLILSLSLPFTDTVDIIQTSLVLIILLTILNLIFLAARKFGDKKGFRKAVRKLSWLLPVLIITAFIFEASWFPLVPDLLYGICLTLIFIFIVIGNVYLFLIDDAKAISGIALMLFYIIVTLILKRINYEDMETHMVFSFLMIGSGMYLFGLKAIFTIEKNLFLKVVSFIACLLILFGSLIMFYFSLTQSNAVLIVYSVSLFLLTLVVLLSLPVAGYVQWSSQHKSILKTILIPWIFFLMLISIRFVFPDLNRLFFRAQDVEFQEFSMDDYPVTDKNGLEPE